MPSRPEDPHARPARAPRWVSPWSFDDEWEDEQRKHLSPAFQPVREQSPPPAKKEDRKPAPEAVTPPLPTVAAKQAGAPAIVSLVEERLLPGEADWVEIEEEPHPATAEVTLPQTESAQRVGLPSSGEIQPSEAPTKTSERPTSRSVPSHSPVEPTPHTSRHRPGPVPNSARVHAEASSAWGTFFITCLGLAGAVLLGWIYLKDIPPPVDDDLILQEPVDLAPKIAGPERLSIFLQAVLAIPDRRLALQPAWKWDKKILESYVRANGAALDGLRDLLGDFDWHPRHSAWHQQDLGGHLSWPHVRILLQARVVYLLSLGNEESALLAAIDIGRLSRRLQDMWAWPSYMQRAQEMHMASVQMMAQVLKQTRLGSSELKLMQDEFMRCAPRDDLLQGALAAYYLHEKKLIFGEHSGAPLDTMPGGVLQERPGRLFFKKQETLSLFAESFRTLRDQVVISPIAYVGRAAAASHRPQVLSHFQPNGEGLRYHDQRIQLCRDMPARHHLARARHDLVLCLFAIRRYVADHQKLPSGLGELRPDYLPDTLLDPFSGETLHYDPLKGVIFSVGANLRDEGGRITEPPLADPDEPTVEIGISVATAVEGTR